MAPTMPDAIGVSPREGHLYLQRAFSVNETLAIKERRPTLSPLRHTSTAPSPPSTVTSATTLDAQTPCHALRLRRVAMLIHRSSLETCLETFSESCPRVVARFHCLGYCASVLCAPSLDHRR